MKLLLAQILKTRGIEDTILFRDEHDLLYLKDYLRSKTGPEISVQTSHAALTPESLISRCARCKDVTDRKTAYGTGLNGVMIVLNAPRMANRAELRIHRAESVDLLKKMVNAIGLELHECYVTNLIKCESSDPFTKPSDMLKNCLDILKQEIGIIQPKIGLVMGELIPVQPVINSGKGITWFNTEHAISLIKNPEFKRAAWETLKVVKKRYMEINNGV